MHPHSFAGRRFFICRPNRSTEHTGYRKLSVTMKLPSLFTLFLCLLLRSSAAPIPSEDNGNQLAPSGNLPPLPGRTESHYDPTTGIATAYYGDDRMPEHMGHVQRNQAQRPENRLPMPASENHELEQNRQEALRGILSGGLFRTYAPLLGNRVRDEKHPAMFSNEHHSTTTTVEYLPAKESCEFAGHHCLVYSFTHLT